MKKKKEAAEEEAKLALEEYESSLNQLQLGDRSKSVKSDKDAPGGRMVFGAPEKVVNRTIEKEKVNNYYGDSDSESDAEAKAEDITQHDQAGKSMKEQDIDPSLLREEFGFSRDSVFKVKICVSILFINSRFFLVHLIEYFTNFSL